ncbi:SIMPL domain-containing protein [candidate division WOR-3 bacterium]|nr:SIMPL domain-containing protein [candidate division WOR-3 bacterium]
MRNVILVFLALFTAASAAASVKPTRTLAVTGTAEVSVKPDICYISFGVETFNKKSAREAYRINSEVMTTLSASVLATGIEAKDVQTSGFSVAPQYHYDNDNRRRVFDGYRVYHSLDVNVRELNQASAVLDAGMDAGATQVNHVTFAVENPKKHTSNARVEAVRAAHAKALTMADLAGVRLGKPISISENEPGGWGQYYAQANVAVDRAASPEESAGLQPGEFKLTRTVYITYEIE